MKFSLHAPEESNLCNYLKMKRAFTRPTRWEYAFGKVAFRKSVYILKHILKTCYNMKMKRAFTGPPGREYAFGKVASRYSMYLYITTVVSLWISIKFNTMSLIKNLFNHMKNEKSIDEPWEENVHTSKGCFGGFFFCCP